MDYDCIELERRLSIGFNEYLSLGKRHEFAEQEKSLEEICRNDKSFRMYLRETRDVIHWLSKSRDNSIIWYGDTRWPSFRPLRKHLPFMLFCTGSRPDPVRRAVAIIGTRHASYAALQQAYRMGLEAAENGVAVVSGFAEGIDQAAMRGAVDGGGTCIGVLACGHEVEYPALTRDLRRRILDCGGCILSRFAPETVAYKSNFISRNMIIASYADIVVAVQAPQLSGTLNTCDYAVQMGKDIFVGSQGVGDMFIQAGTTDLFNTGATMINTLSEAENYFAEMSRCVLEWDGRKDSGQTRRFGDMIYVVRDGIN